jgi:hypothetical protein
LRVKLVYIGAGAPLNSMKHLSNSYGPPPLIGITEYCQYQSFFLNTPIQLSRELEYLFWTLHKFYHKARRRSNFKIDGRQNGSDSRKQSGGNNSRQSGGNSSGQSGGNSSGQSGSNNNGQSGGNISGQSGGNSSGEQSSARSSRGPIGDCSTSIAKSGRGVTCSGSTPYAG